MCSYPSKSFSFERLSGGGTSGKAEQINRNAAVAGAVSAERKITGFSVSAFFWAAGKWLSGRSMAEGERKC